MSETIDHVTHMIGALGLARRGLGNVWPNPAVGCILVKDGVIVGRGWTQPGGRPHAETEALRRAGDAAQGATAYVTLEPCDHQGQTPPCSQALIDAGIRTVVVATTDPDPRVAGKGVERLIEAGIEVIDGVCRDEAQRLNAGFFSAMIRERPQFTVKTATTLDGRIAVHTGESKWITGANARAMAHKLRAEHDGIVAGIGTVLADDPELTCRLPGLGHRSPVRIVFDSRLRLPLTSKLVRTAKELPVWVFALPGGDSSRIAAYADCGVEVIESAVDEAGNPDVSWAAKEMAARGMTRVLVEGGSHLIAALFRDNLVDRLAWMRSPMVIGGDGVPAAMPFGVDSLADAPRFTRHDIVQVGDDVVEFLDKQDYQNDTVG